MLRAVLATRRFTLPAADPHALARACGGRAAAFEVRLRPDGDRVLDMAPDGDIGTAVIVDDMTAGFGPA